MHGIVKGVLSGDSLVIMGTDASKGPPPEKLITLSGIMAPRLANRNNNTSDQPFAWGAREFLRRTVIGKTVSFISEASTGSGTGAPREFGSVFLDDTSVAALMVMHGWAKLKHNDTNEELVQLERVAQERQLGMHAPPESVPDAVRVVQWAGTFDTAELLQQIKGVPQDAVIEQVPGGSLLRVMLLPGFHQITLMLSGVQCPAIRRTEGGGEEAAPFAREARYFVDSRLQHRDVQVRCEGIDKNGVLLGTVLHSQGNISLELVKVGLARVADWSAQMCENGPALRQAEKAAKEKRVRIWREYVPPNHGDDMTEFQGRVSEVVSGDTLMVLDASGVERRITMSSVRCPRRDDPYGGDAKEYVRRLLIGKKVKVVPEYRRTFEAQQEGQQAMERVFATVLYNNDKNAAQSLIADGLGSVQQGRADERSTFYEELLEGEKVAAAAKKGIHSSGPPPVAKCTDLTLPTARERAKSYLNQLQRGGKLRAVVQFVVNGARFKLLLPKENCLITFVCVGLKCPACARRDNASAGGGAEPFGDEAVAFTRGLCFQRDVEIEVESMDKMGNFLGSLILADKRNLGVTLLENGLAHRMGGAADRSSCGEELRRAEQSAKDANRKIWEGYSEEEEARLSAERAAVSLAEEDPTPDSQKQMVELSLTEVIDGAHFYAQVANDANVALLQQKLAAACLKGSAVSFEGKSGAMCCARFTQDDEWYRAKVTKKLPGGKFEVFFIDYGNSDVVGADRLKPLDPTLGATTIAAQALECRLAYLTVGSTDDNAEGQEAAIVLGQYGWGKLALARVEDRQSSTLLVTLFDGSQTNINEALVETGLARTEKNTPKRAHRVVSTLKEKELAAKTSRQGMWRYGDIEEDDAAEFGAPGRPTTVWGKK